MSDSDSVYVHHSVQAEAGDDDILRLPVGTVLIDRLEISGFLGSGGFGIVYSALDRERQGRECALKEFLPSQHGCVRVGSRVSARNRRDEAVFEQGRAAFIEEARLLKALSHPAIVQVDECFEANGTAYIVMERLHGETLDTRLERHVSWDEETLRGLLETLLGALDYLHSKRILHRDLTPRNVFLVEGRGPVLIDFGSARQCIGKVSHSLTAIASQGYAPIEQYDDHGLEEQGPPTDLYALGATFYHLATGNRPIAATSRTVKDRLRPATEVAAGRYGAVFLKSLDKALKVSAEERWQTSTEWARALNEESTPPKRPQSPRPDGDPPPDRKALWIGLLVVLCVIVGGVFGYRYYQEVQAMEAKLRAEREENESKAKTLRAAADLKARLELEFPPGRHFKECEDCPVLVVIPSGSFDMGSPAGEKGRQKDEGPIHRVTIAQRFAMGNVEVTVGQWRAFVRATGYVSDAERNAHGGKGCISWDVSRGKDAYVQGRQWGKPSYAQSDEHPVVCVSFDDVGAYLKWLSDRTGKAYRLPSEAEWEYAVRAGSQSSRPWGEARDDACRFANVSDRSKEPKDLFFFSDKHDCDDGHFYPAPVGSYLPNGFGLQDMIGNVWEWVEDCWNESFGGAPADGSAWRTGDCGRRVLRGGAWGSGPDVARSANRNGDFSGYRFDVIGFRVARTLF
ncbi:bifunctional serine/threonine-protein kinase/formylglycine-generating enzyme family protein [Zoogloea sp.]|uniref:bifunctional serine/threonine-protein kinase/formylglycine-generating enzyme family protein n=1 Tax=Zoogloea sp. TaxID=49181 RepID=UPI0025D39885|nr:bifunctional serine/threonine-protein kinase/formylglycine-generating enzyme family protein [Zoogloea sp.]MCK6394558.1 bifunctional serine/threonine-protein kinase/formylglycine-generating enzyme family protein [Zoogloea sp.]